MAGLNFYVKKQDEGQWCDYEGTGTEFLIRRATNEETMAVAEAKRKEGDNADYKQQLKPVEKVVLQVWKGTKNLTVTPGDEATAQQMKDSGFPADKVLVDKPLCVDEYLNDNIKRFLLREDPAFPSLLTWISTESARLRLEAQKHEAELSKA